MVRYLLKHLLGGQVAYTFLSFGENRRGARSKNGDRPRKPRLIEMSQRKDLLLLDLTGLVLTQLIMLGLFFVFAEWWMYFVLWALPAATLTSFFNAVRALVEHFNEEGDTVPVDERRRKIFMVR